ncbi:MAG: hypothetical protein VW378_00590 [bacterium]
MPSTRAIVFGAIALVALTSGYYEMAQMAAIVAVGTNAAAAFSPPQPPAHPPQPPALTGQRTLTGGTAPLITGGAAQIDSKGIRIVDLKEAEAKANSMEALGVAAKTRIRTTTQNIERIDGLHSTEGYGRAQRAIDIEFRLLDEDTKHVYRSFLTEQHAKNPGTFLNPDNLKADTPVRVKFARVENHELTKRLQDPTRNIINVRFSGDAKDHIEKQLEPALKGTTKVWGDLTTDSDGNLVGILGDLYEPDAFPTSRGKTEEYRGRDRGGEVDDFDPLVEKLNGNQKKELFRALIGNVFFNGHIGGLEDWDLTDWIMGENLTVKMDGQYIGAAGITTPFYKKNIDMLAKEASEWKVVHRLKELKTNPSLTPEEKQRVREATEPKYRTKGLNKNDASQEKLDLLHELRREYETEYRESGDNGYQLTTKDMLEIAIETIETFPDKTTLVDIYSKTHLHTLLREGSPLTEERLIELSERIAIEIDCLIASIETYQARLPNAKSALSTAKQSYTDDLTTLLAGTYEIGSTNKETKEQCADGTAKMSGFRLESSDTPERVKGVGLKSHLHTPMGDPFRKNRGVSLPKHASEETREDVLQRLKTELSTIAQGPNNTEHDIQKLLTKAINVLRDDQRQQGPIIKYTQDSQNPYLYRLEIKVLNLPTWEITTVTRNELITILEGIERAGYS